MGNDEMIVLALPPKEAARITSGTQTVVTYPTCHVCDSGPLDMTTASHDCTDARLFSLVGQTVAIAATGGIAAAKYRMTYNAIVGSARVEAVVPIDNDCRCPVCGGTNTYDTPADCRGCNGGLPDGWSLDFTPGRWTVIFTDAAPCEERCPACQDSMPLRTGEPCPACVKAAAGPIPYDATGPIGGVDAVKPYDFHGDEGRSDDPVPVGVACGDCGGPIYFERCMDHHSTNHEWATAGECQRCGARTEHSCPECGHQDGPIGEWTP